MNYELMLLFIFVAGIWIGAVIVSFILRRPVSKNGFTPPRQMPPAKKGKSP